MGAGVTNNGVLDTDATGGGGSTFVAIGQPVNATDAAVLNTTPAGTEYGIVVRPIGGGGGGAATIADGADVNAGATTDAAVVTDTNGTLSGKLRGLVKWAFERMPVSLGQKVMTASFPVVIASDQSTLPISGSVTGTVAVSNFPATQPVSGTVDTKTDLTPSAPSAVSVGVATGLAVAANANRKGLRLVNTSSAVISLGFGSPAVLNSGVTLLPYGSFNMDEYDFDLGAVNAIASAAASNLAIQEYTT